MGCGPFPLPFDSVASAPFSMPVSHESLDVYGVALDFIALADEIVAQLPRGRGHLADQLGRASTSIVLSLAEGAGKFSKPDKRRYYLIAVGSTTECAAILDVLLRLKLVVAGRHSEGKSMLERIAAMLVKLAKAQEE